MLPSSTWSAEVQAHHTYHLCVEAVYRPCAYPCELYHRQKGRAEADRAGYPSSSHLLAWGEERLQLFWEMDNRHHHIRLCEDEGAVDRVVKDDVQAEAQVEAQGAALCDDDAQVGAQRAALRNDEVSVEEPRRRIEGELLGAGVALVGGFRHSIRGRALDRDRIFFDEEVRC